MTSHASSSPTAPSRPLYSRQPRRALLVAAVATGVLVIQSLVSYAVWFPASLGQGDAGSSIFGFVFELVGLLAFGGGVFLLLWLVPVSPADRIPMVLTKALLATAGGMAASMVVGAVGALLLFPVRGFWAFLGDLPTVIGSVLDRAPLVMLVVLIQWVVLRERRA